MTSDTRRDLRMIVGEVRAYLEAQREPSVASSVNNVPREPTYEPVYDGPPGRTPRNPLACYPADGPGRPRFASRSRWRGARPPPDPAFALDFLYRR